MVLDRGFCKTNDQELQSRPKVQGSSSHCRNPVVTGEEITDVGNHCAPGRICFQHKRLNAHNSQPQDSYLIHVTCSATVVLVMARWDPLTLVGSLKATGRMKP